MTQEFHISITPVRDNEYLVRTEQVAPGVPLAEEQLVWPVDQWLEQTRQLMNDPLLGLLRGQSGNGSAGDLASVNGFMELGQQLYQHLFQGILRDSWMTAQGIAQHRGEVLRLRLGLKGNQLPKLPWEVMHGHTRDGLGLTTHPLATGVNLLFSRYQPDRHIAQSGMATIPNKSSVVRVLMVLALPADQDQLELDQEARQLQHELRLQSEHLQEHVVGTLPDIQVSILKHPSRTQLAQALEQAQYHVLHYAGHSDLGNEGGKLYLVDQHGLAETLTGDDLAGLLVNNGIQMAVFNSCRGGHTANGAKKAGHAARTLTDALVSRGIPAVLAMAERIPDDVALALTRFFYRNLKQGYPVDLSLSRARQALLASYGSSQLYWALPTLYLHPDFDGYLTVGDRLLDNPADTLSRIPQFNTPSLLDWENTPITDSAPLPHPPANTGLTGSWTGARPSTDLGEAAEDHALVSTFAAPDAEDSEAIAPKSNITNVTSQYDLDSISSAADVDLYDYELGDESQADGADDDPGDFLLSPEETAELTRDAGEEPKHQEELAREAGEEPKHQKESADSADKSGSIDSTVPPSGGSGATSVATTGIMLSSAHADRADTDPDTNGNLVKLANESTGNPDVALVHQPSDRSQTLATAPSVQIAARIDEPESRVARRRVGPPPWLYPVAGGAVAALAIAFVGYRVYGELMVQKPDSPRMKTTVELVSDASNKLEAGDWQEAGEILEKVDTMALDEPQVLFLQGRLIWEQLRANADTNSSVEDARQFWEKAVAQDNEPLYYNALGFALYGEGRMNDAVEAWTYALEELEKQDVVVVPDTSVDAETNASIAVPPGTITHPEALTAYAGIALALAQLAVESPQVDQQVDSMSKVLKIQQVIRNSAPSMFESETLRSNWLWTESTIIEWEHLSQVQFQ
ncbi:MAG: CHAT domain-containing protein [Cyanothece sp. SIO2G6]|nr:CHAT domain-containing protein [Cyanothece sp. SIO2G6]